MKASIIAIVFACLLAACGGSAEPFEANGDGSKPATVDKPECKDGGCK